MDEMHTGKILEGSRATKRLESPRGINIEYRVCAVVSANSLRSTVRDDHLHSLRCKYPV